MVTDLTAAQARSLVEEINALVDSLNERLLRFYTGRGWLALGYASFADCARETFGLKTAMLYRRLQAARLSDALDTPLLPAHAAALSKVDASARADVLTLATQYATSQGRSMTTSDIVIASETKIHAAYNAWIANGKVTALQALQGSQTLAAIGARNGLAAMWLGRLVLEYGLHDSGAMVALEAHYRHTSQTCYELRLTGCLDIGDGVQVQLLHATRELVELAWEVARKAHIAEKADDKATWLALWPSNPQRTAAALRKEFDANFLQALVKELGNE